MPHVLLRETLETLKTTVPETMHFRGPHSACEYLALNYSQIISFLDYPCPHLSPGDLEKAAEEIPHQKAQDIC